MFAVDLITTIQYIITFISLFITIFFVLVFVKNIENIKENKTDSEPQDNNWTPKISVVIPAYNEEALVEKCIKSVLDSDYPKEKLEIIVVDDGSTDKTYENAKKYEKEGVRVFKKKPEGTAAATKNYGIKKATGEIIATLDADSYIKKDTIRKMLRLFNSDEVAAVTAAVKVDEGDKNILTKIQKVEYLVGVVSRKILGIINSVHVTPGPFSVFRSWVFEKVGYFDPHNITEDNDLALRIQMKNYIIRSSFSAEAYTEVPSNFDSLFKQRVRWYRGGLRNSIKYLNMIGPHYGDFGLIVMPMTLILAFVGIVSGSMAVLGYFTTPPGTYLNYYTTELSPVTFAGLILVIINALWILAGLSLFKREKVGHLSIFIYIIAYSYLVTIYWLVAVINELKGEKLNW